MSPCGGSQSFYPCGYDNLNVVELHGRNSRIVFPFRRIEKLRGVPREEWSAQGRVTDVLSSHSILHDSGLREDRHAACQIQSGLASGVNTHFTFGHYEQAIGHFHRCLTKHVEMLKRGT